MKLIIAVVRSNKLDQVREKLIEKGIERITVSRASGHGRYQNKEVYRGKEIVPGLTPKIRIEIAVNEEFVERTIDAILEAGRENSEDNGGTLGDGKIFIMPLEEVIRIRTGERGKDAI